MSSTGRGKIAAGRSSRGSRHTRVSSFTRRRISTRQTHSAAFSSSAICPCRKRARHLRCRCARGARARARACRGYARVCSGRDRIRGHAAQAHLCVDPIFISAQLISALQGLMSREKPASTPSVLSFGNIRSIGGTTNIIPDEVKLEGTFRSLDEEWRTKAHIRIQEVCSGIASSFNATCDVNIQKGYPCLLNDPKMTSDLIQNAKVFLGEENVKHLEPRLTSEDFAYYSHQIPAVFYRLGVGNVPGVHTSNFDIEESAIKIGSGLMAFLAMKM